MYMCSNSLDEILSRFEELSSMIPDWITMATSGAVKTVRINKGVSLQSVKDKISGALMNL